MDSDRAVAERIESSLVENLDLHSYDFGVEDGFIDVKKAWDMEGLHFQVPMRDVEHVIREPSWNGGQLPVEIGHVVPHWSLILLADLSFPIIVTVEPDSDRLTVVDGRHRVVKAWLLGNEHMDVKYLNYYELIDKAAVPRDFIGGELPLMED